MNNINDYPVILISRDAEFNEKLGGFLRNDTPVPGHAPFETEICPMDADFKSTLAKIQHHDLSYCIAFVDAEASPNNDPLNTIRSLWETDKHMQIVICMHPANPVKIDLYHLLGHNGRTVLLKKPFEQLEVHLIAQSLHQKYQLHKHIHKLATDDLILREHILQNSELSLKLKKTKSEFDDLKSRFAAFSDLATHLDNHFAVPLDDIKNNIRVLETSFTDINRLLVEYKLASNNPTAKKKLEKIEKDIDMTYARSGFPDAARKIDDAIKRLASHFSAIQDITNLTHAARH